ALATDVRFEIVVVDSSTDGTAELVAADFPAVRLVTAKERLYPGTARNAGIAEARGEILSFTDADCVVEPNWLAELAQLHRRGVHVAHLHVADRRAYLGRKWRHGRAFARVRASYSRFGRGRCAVGVVVAPAVPGLLFLRTAAAALRAGLGRDFILSAPLVFAGQV